MSRTEGKISLKVWGDYACFTQPALKAERVSYPIITPSAARGVLEAVFWKPEIRFEIRDILVLRLGGTMTILRNELEDMKGTGPVTIEDNRQQRSSLILKDVAYLINASIVVRPYAVEKNPVQKYLDCFNRRLDRGQCHHTPYLGTREFAAAFDRSEGNEVPDEKAKSLNLGTMLFDIAYVEDGKGPLQFHRHDPDGHRVAKGHAEPLFFNAQENFRAGKLHVPPEKYGELYQREDNHA